MKEERVVTLSSRRRPLSAAVAAFGPVVFLVCEAIAAFAWTAGTYGYGVNFISDLGTTVCGSYFSGRVMCSPLHGVMNFGLAAMGVAVALAVSLMAVAFPRRRRITTTVLGCLLAVGMLLVAVFHGGVESVQNGMLIFHVLGAVVAIICGNTLGIIVGATSSRLGFPRWFKPVAVALGVIGIVSLGGCLLFGSAVFERMAVYSIFAWLLVASSLLIRSRDDHGPVANAAAS
jgi:type IV secretory pathway VirB2 component (pilin)